MRVKCSDVATECRCNERAALQILVDAFAKEVRAEVVRHLDEGKSGWDREECWASRGDPADTRYMKPLVGALDAIKAKVDSMTDMLAVKAELGEIADEAVDMAAYAMFMWNLTQAPAPRKDGECDE